MDAAPTTITETIHTVEGLALRGHIEKITPVLVEGSPEELATTVKFISPNGESRQVWVSAKEAKRLSDVATIRELNRRADDEE